MQHYYDSNIVFGKNTSYTAFEADTLNGMKNYYLCTGPKSRVLLLLAISVNFALPVMLLLAVSDKLGLIHVLPNPQ